MKFAVGIMLAMTSCGLFKHNVATAAQSSANAPQYCIDFDADACAKISAVVETGKRPKYCASDFATNSSLHLSREQYRICYQFVAMYGSREQEQRMEDARAMIKEDWASYAKIIESLEVGYKCEVIDELPFSVAVREVQVEMQEAQLRAGLVNDQTLNIQSFTSDAIESGKNAYKKDVCARITPATRGRLRAMADDLVRAASY